MEAPTLEAREVVKEYAAVRAVDGLSFDVRRGEIFALLGPNGAGKTTMVRMLLGIIRPDSGSIAWCLDGRRSAGADPHRLGYLPEERGLHKDVPILRSLIYFGMLHRMSKVAARAAAVDWLERLELSDRANDKLDSLSKGNQQKIQFAAAVLHRPAVAVLDEPFSGFDPVNQERFLDHIRQMRDEGTTVLLSAHQMPLVERAADRIMLIERGKCVLEGTLDEIRRRSQVGRCLLLELRGAFEIERLAECPGVVTAECVETEASGGSRSEAESGNASAAEMGAARTTRVRLGLESDGPLNELMSVLVGCVEVVGIHDERPTLHDIYIEAVRSAGRPA